MLVLFHFIEIKKNSFLIIYLFLLFCLGLFNIYLVYRGCQYYLNYNDNDDDEDDQEDFQLECNCHLCKEHYARPYNTY